MNTSEWQGGASAWPPERPTPPHLFLQEGLPGLGRASVKYGRTDQVAVRPFIKWAGGKSRLLALILPLVPQSIRRYYEPFLGGGAVLLALSTGRHAAAACDLNDDLICAWQAVKQDPQALHERLTEYEAKHSESFYYGIRGRVFTDTIDRAAHFIYLNRSAWNGLYRVNGRGEFNVPWGARPLRMPTQEHLVSVHRALRHVSIECADFRETLREPGAGDFVYLDPPYLRISDTSKFNGYTPQKFVVRDMEDLAELCHAMHQRGASWILSNRDSKVVRELFARYQFLPLTIRRAIAAQNRRDVEARESPELIITNIGR